MDFNVNFVGNIPYNTDILPEIKLTTGPGSERPLGFTLDQISLLYWTVRSFAVNISAFSLGDPLSQFIAAGGTSGGIIGAQAGLANVNNNSSCNPISLNGNTKLISANVVRIRQQPSAVINSTTQTSIDLDKNVNPNRLVQIFSPVSEGTLVTAGPVHRIALSSAISNAYMLIDFSDIIYSTSPQLNKVKLYWPRIIIIASSNCFSFGSLASFGGNVASSGGINFCNMGVIEVFGNTTVQFPVVNSVQGKISIGTRCCDRFYWDGRDYVTCQDASIPNGDKDCQSVDLKDANYGKSAVVGVFNNSNTISPNPGGFSGGGGQSGGGGANGSW
jgi:uncharacterized membrane protein YgcG